MIRIADKDENTVYIYSEHISDIYHLMPKMNFVCTTTYEGYPALLVKKENNPKS